MKKNNYPIYLLIILLVTGLLSCNKNAPQAFNQSPQQRVTAALTKYETALTGAPYGWKATLTLTSGGVYLFSMKFDTGGRVSMLSDIDSTKSATSASSSYRLRQQESPSLLFDTYSYIHLLADPVPAVSGAVEGSGLNSDFEFSFNQAAGDSVTLTGNRNGSKLVLTKATSQADYDSFTKGTTVFLSNFNKLRTYFKRTTINGINCDINVNSGTRQITFNSFVKDSLVSVSAQFYIDGSTNVMTLLTPVTIGNKVVTTISGIAFDAVNRVISGSVNGTLVQIKEAIVPIYYDIKAAAAFYNNPADYGVYWISSEGFTVDNVQDAYKITAITGFQFLVFYPLTATKEKGTRIGFFLNSGYGSYGPEIIPSLPLNGKIVFNFWGSYGDPPKAIAPAVNSTTLKFIDPNGFYVIKTGPATYDLVDVTDAREWISFQ